MLSLRVIQKLQDQRSPVKLEDGRVGKIVRVDTTFPANRTEVSVYTKDGAVRHRKGDLGASLSSD